MKTLKSSLFELCTKLKKMDDFKSLRESFSDLSKRGCEVEDKKRDLFLECKSLNLEFYGILLCSELHSSSEESIFSATEMYNFKFGHSLIEYFIDNALNDFLAHSNISNILNPYCYYKNIKKDDTSFSFDYKILNDAIASLKCSKVYRSIVNLRSAAIINSIPYNDLLGLIDNCSKTVCACFDSDVPLDIVSIMVKKDSAPVDSTEQVYLDLFRILALRTVIQSCVKLIFKAILGGDIFVIDDKTLIDIEKNTSNFLVDYKTVQIDGMVPELITSIMGDIVLLDFNYSGFIIHEFGRVYSHTFNYSLNTVTTKLTYYVIDDDMNVLSYLYK